MLPEVHEVAGRGEHSRPGRPILYYPHARQVYLGPEGWYHQQMMLAHTYNHGKSLPPGEPMRAVLHQDGYLDTYDEVPEEVSTVLEQHTGLPVNATPPQWRTDNNLWKEADLVGDAFPGQEPQAIADQAVAPDRHRDWNPTQEYKFVYANGQLHVSEEHEHEELFGHAGVPDLTQHAGPMAVGHIHVDMGKATFEMDSNIGAQAIARVLKDYAKQQGWRWGGMTDASGEPVGTGSEFAPVKSYYFSCVNQGPATEQELRIASKRLNSSFNGVVHVDPPYADARPLTRENYAALKEFADDRGLQLVAGNDNVLKKIEDLEQGNTYSPEWNDEDDHFTMQSPKDERQPGGVYKCPHCGQIFHSWGIYLRHRSEEEPPGDESPETHVDEFRNMDVPMPPHFHDQPSFTEAKLAQDLPRVVDLQEDDFNVPPTKDFKNYGWRRPVIYYPEHNVVGLGPHGSYHWDVHDTMRNLHHDLGRDYRGWVSVEPHEYTHPSEMDRPRGFHMRQGDNAMIHGVQQALIPHVPEAQTYIANPHGGDSEWITGKVAMEIPKVINITDADGGMQNDQANYGWRRPVLYHPATDTLAIGPTGAYHYNLVHALQDQGYRGQGLQHFDEGWVSVAEPHPEAYDQDRPRGFHMRYTEATTGRLQQALIPHAPEAANYIEDPHDEDSMWMTGKVAVSAPQAKDLIQAAIPFIYDIDKDTIDVGQPGMRTSDIPGQFTPGGIVEGRYEPGGKVFITTMTNMPWTARHLLELWYYQFPHMEVRSLNLEDSEGKRTKLAEWQDA